MKFLTLLLAILFSFTANATLRENDKQYLGHPNLLINPGFENGLSNWTNSVGTASRETTTFLEGKAAYKVALSAGTLSLLQEITNTKIAGKTFGVSCQLKADLATTLFSLCALVDSAEVGCTPATAATEFTKFATNHLVPATGVIGLKIKTSGAVTDSVFIDSCQMSIDPFVFIGTLGTNQFAARVANSGSATLTSESSSFISTVTRSALGIVDVVFKTGIFSVAPSVVSVGDTANFRGLTVSSITATGFTVKTFTVASSPGASDLDFDFIVTKQGLDFESETNVVAFNERAQNGQIRLHTGNGHGSTDNKIRRITNHQLDGEGAFTSIAASSATTSDGSITVSDTAAGGTILTINKDDIYHIIYQDSSSNAGSFGLSLNSSQLTTALFNITEADRLSSTTIAVNFESVAPWSGILKIGDTVRFHTDATPNGTSGANTVHATISRIGVGQLIGTPLPLTAYIKDQKPANTIGGGFNSGDWRIRTLNNLSGVTSFISLASNQFTLSPGTYDIVASAPGFFVGHHKAKIYNITDAADESSLIGTSEDSQDATAGDAVVTHSFIKGQITIVESKTYELRHQCQTTNASNGLGIQSNFSVVEIYSQIKITKVN